MPDNREQQKLNDINNLSLESLKKSIKEFGMEFPKIGLLTKEEVLNKRAILGGFALDSLGDEIYQLPGGGLTGKGGWKLFEKALEDKLNKEGYGQQTK